MITALEIVFNVLLGVGLVVGYLATGVHVAHRQFEIFVKAGQPRETALSRSRHLIMDWAPYVMIDGIKAIGTLIDGKICDVPLTETEREAQIKRLEIDMGIIDQVPAQGDLYDQAQHAVKHGTRLEALAAIDRVPNWYRDQNMAGLKTGLMLDLGEKNGILRHVNVEIMKQRLVALGDRPELSWGEAVVERMRETRREECLSGRTREDKELIEAANDMAKNAVLAGLCGYRTVRRHGETESMREMICLRPVDALHHHAGKHEWATVAKRQR
jgi:hypothetical protein